jgi:hypothetical protein
MTSEERIEAIWSILHGMAERENQMEIRFNQDIERRNRRIEQQDTKWQKRMDQFDRRQAATQKLVQFGMKLLVKIESRQKQAEEETAAMKQAIRDLAKSQKAFMDSLRKGNGNERLHA